MPITFQVNLSTVNEQASKTPYNSTEGPNFKYTRSTWFPDFLRNNRALKHGDTFDVAGIKAIYLRDNYTTGTFKFLDVIAGAP